MSFGFDEESARRVVSNVKALEAQRASGTQQRPSRYAPSDWLHHFVQVTSATKTGGLYYPGKWYEHDASDDTWDQQEDVWVAFANDETPDTGVRYRAQQTGEATISSDTRLVFTATIDEGDGGIAGITVREQDGSPLYTEITTLSFLQDDGFTISNPSAGYVLIQIQDASASQAGIVNVGGQTFLGHKVFTNSGSGTCWSTGSSTGLSSSITGYDPDGNIVTTGTAGLLSISATPTQITFFSADVDYDSNSYTAGVSVGWIIRMYDEDISLSTVITYLNVGTTGPAIAAGQLGGYAHNGNLGVTGGFATASGDMVSVSGGIITQIGNLTGGGGSSTPPGGTGSSSIVDPSQSSISASPVTVAADGSATATITVVVRNSAGNPLSSVTVVPYTDGTNVTFTPTSDTTGADGTLTFTASSTDEQTIDFSANAGSQIIGPSNDVAFLDDDDVDPASSSITAQTPAYAGMATLISVNAKNVGAANLAGKTVTLTDNGSFVTITPASAVTNANGNAYFFASTSAPGGETGIEFTATVDGETVGPSGAIDFDVVNVAGPESPGAVSTLVDNSLPTWQAVGTDGGEVTVPAGTATHHITFTDFGFSIPGGSTINAILLTIEKTAVDPSLSSNAGIFDQDFKLVLDGAPAGWQGATYTEIDWGEYGGDPVQHELIYTGGAPTVSQVNDSGNFGVMLSVENLASAVRIAQVANVQLTVFYTPP